MSNQLKAELLKVRSTRTTLGLFAGMAALSLLIVLLTALLSSKSGLYGEHNQIQLFAPSAVAVIFAGLAGVLLITSEYRYGTIRPTFLVTPRRTTVISAKLIAGFVAGLVFGAVSLGIAIGVGSLILSARGIPSAVTGGDFTQLVLGGLAATALWGALGIGIGMILRAQVGAVIALLAWDFVLDSLLFGLAPSVGRFMPTVAANALMGLNTKHLLPGGAGGLVLVGWTLLLGLIGWSLTLRRDVL